MALEFQTTPPSGLRDALVGRRKEIRNRLDVLNGKAVRRMLESDLGLEAKQLDPFKALVDNLIDEVVIGRSKDSQEDSQQPPDTQSSRDQGAPGAPPSKKIKAKDDDVAVAKDQACKSKPKTKAEPKAKPAKKKVSKQSKSKGLSYDEGMEEEEEEDTGSGPDSDEDQEARPAPKKGSKAKAQPAVKLAGGPKFSKQVERLREICKKATIKIPPALYKRGPDGSEDRMIEGLEGLLAKHGLDANSKDGEIKAAKKQIERMRELEGIDTSNIMEATGRRPRRAAASINFREIYNQMGEGGSDAEDQEEDEEKQQQRGGSRGSEEDDEDAELESQTERRGKGSDAGGAKKNGRGAGALGKRSGRGEEVEEERGSAAKRSRSQSEEPGMENEGAGRREGAAAPASAARSEQSWGSGSEELPENGQKADGLEDEDMPTPAAATTRKSPGSGSKEVKREQRGGRRRAALEEEEDEDDEEEERKGNGNKAAPKKARKAMAAAESDSDEASQEEASPEEEEESDFNPSEESD